MVFVCERWDAPCSFIYLRFILSSPSEKVPPLLALSLHPLHISTPFPGKNCRLETQVLKDPTTYHEEFTKIHLVMLIFEAPILILLLGKCFQSLRAQMALDLVVSAPQSPVMNRGAVRDTEITRQSCPAPTQQAADARSIVTGSSSVRPWEAQMRDVTSPKKD